ncbi:MAG: hypothetical protein IIT48_10100 [Lachnospiraceae bacterium]|jgi:hypothetical protein|nr:hypothetical protein [Lachnospiraceae bacterium]
MICIGEKNKFALEFEDTSVSIFRCWIKGINACAYIYDNERYDCHCHISDIIQWFIDCYDIIVSDDNYPLGIEAKNALEFYNKSGEFESDDIDIFDEWYTTRQEWYFRHSFYWCRRNEYLPDIFFEKKGNYINIIWDMVDLYNDVKYIYPQGDYLINISDFCEVINEFIKYKEV